MNVIVLTANEHPAGRFGMSLSEAKDYFLARARQHGLEPIKVLSGDSVFVSFYHPRQKKPEGWKMPWEGLRNLAYDFGAHFDEGGDPPWDYTLAPEKPLPDPPAGKYVLMDGREAH